MASGQSAMLVHCVVSAVSVSACICVSVFVCLFCPCAEINVTVAV